MLDMNQVVGSHDILLLTLDTLRYDVAREAHAQIHEHLGRPVAGDKIWVIGDTPLDVKCARAIGARVVAVATGQHTVAQLAESDPDLVLADLSDTRMLIERWAA